MPATSAMKLPTNRRVMVCLDMTRTSFCGARAARVIATGLEHRSEGSCFRGPNGPLPSPCGPPNRDTSHWGGRGVLSESAIRPSNTVHRKERPMNSRLTKLGIVLSLFGMAFVIGAGYAFFKVQEGQNSLTA